MSFYTYNIIQNILKRFKVNDIIITGLYDKSIVDEIINYDATFTLFDLNYVSNFNEKIKIIKDYPLDSLNNLNDYDAIFINDDANWFTVYNELNLVKKNNEEFPLVFICNNRFPNKRRDSYYDPNIIPKEYRKESLKELPICFKNNKINISDGNFHACLESDNKNGVLTAIDDFLNENKQIGIMDINFIEEITILFPKNSINQIRISCLFEEIKNKSIENLNYSDKIFENKILFNYINENKITNENLQKIEDLKTELSNKNNAINTYKNKIQIHNNELMYKDSQIDSIESELMLTNSKIKNYETKLFSKEYEIESLKNKVQSTTKQLKENNTQIKQMKSEIKEFNENDKFFKSFKNKYFHQLSEIDTKNYYIDSCNDEISNNHLEIQYLKDNSFVKTIISPFSYLYLIIKSHPKEIFLNIKLFRLLKNSKCFDIGYYLNNNQDIQKSKWIKYFSPELHYVCNGFSENREFNKKYFNRTSKKELIEYILTCEKMKK